MQCLLKRLDYFLGRCRLRVPVVAAFGARQERIGAGVNRLIHVHSCLSLTGDSKFDRTRRARACAASARRALPISPEGRQRSRLLFLRDNPAFRVDEYPVAVAVLACREVIVVRLPFGTDNLTAWQAQQRDDRCQVLEQGNVFRGRRWSCEEYCKWEYQGQSPNAAANRSMSCCRSKYNRTASSVCWRTYDAAILGFI